MNLLKSKEKNNDIMIGRHMSVSNPDFLVGAVKRAVSYGANALALFIGSPHSHYRRNILELKPKDLKKFLENDKKISIKNIIVHASYVINLGNVLDSNTFQSSVKLLRTDIKRMSIIGLETIVIHPGYALSASRSESILQIAKGINQILIDNPPVRIALETMSGKGSEIGINFREINEIIQKIERKEKVGVC
jgi:deoxyribonuclease-4